jgi:hypothetical protein
MQGRLPPRGRAGESGSDSGPNQDRTGRSPETKLKRLVADLALDKVVLQDVAQKNF